MVNFDIGKIERKSAIHNKTSQRATDTTNNIYASKAKKWCSC